MRKIGIMVLLGCILVMSGGCATLLTTTGTKNINFGMSKEKVLSEMHGRGEVISQDENTIVFDGMQEQLKQPAIKTFIFKNNQLIAINEKIK